MNDILHTSLLILLEAISYQVIMSTTLVPRIRFSVRVDQLLSTILIWFCNITLALIISNPIGKGISIILSTIFIGYFFYSAKMFIRFYVVSFVYVLIIAGDALAIISVYALYDNTQMLESGPAMYKILFSFAPKLIILFVVFILSKVLFTRNLAFLDNKLSTILSIVLMFGNVVIVINLTNAPTVNTGITVLSVICLILFDILLYYFLEQLFLQVQKNSDNLILRYQNQMQMDHIDEITALNQNRMEFLHDYNNQLLILNGLLHKQEYQKAINLLDNLQCNVLSLHYDCFTGNAIVDAIANAKGELAKKKGIHFSVKSNNLQELPLLDVDLVCLLSNLLDNAIENVDSNEADGRTVLLKMHFEDEQLVLVVENTIAARPVEVDGKLLSTKTEQEYHGYGLISVESVLSKYNAESELFYDDHLFRFVAIINF